MPHFTSLIACVFGVAALTAGSAYAEYDSGGAPTNPAQIQANRPQASKEWIYYQLSLKTTALQLDRFKAEAAERAELNKMMQALLRTPPIAPSPAPAKKPLPKPLGRVRAAP
jgi:hypothetical protein